MRKFKFSQTGALRVLFINAMVKEWRRYAVAYCLHDSKINMELQNDFLYAYLGAGCDI